MEGPQAPPNVVDKGRSTPSKHSGLWFSFHERKPADGSSKGSTSNPQISPGLPLTNVIGSGGFSSGQSRPMTHAFRALIRTFKAAPLSRKAAPLWRMWSCTMPRTYSARGTPDWKANAFSAARYSGGIRAQSLAPNMRARPNAEQFHQECLTCGGGHIR